MLSLPAEPVITAARAGAARRIRSTATSAITEVTLRTGPCALCVPVPMDSLDVGVIGPPLGRLALRRPGNLSRKKARSFANPPCGGFALSELGVYYRALLSLAREKRTSSK